MVKESKKQVFLNISLLVILFATVFFQSCNPTKLSSNPPSEDTKNRNSTSSEPTGFFAPNSVSGVASLSGTAVSADKIIIAKEYKYSLADRYFITARSNDQSIVETGALKNQFTETDAFFNFYELPVAGSSELCRFFIPSTKAHYYTADSNECNLLKANSWYINEGVEGYVIKINLGATCPANTSPVYKSFSNSSEANEKRNRYTMSITTLNTLISKGWTNEGIAFCSPDKAPAAIPGTASCDFNGVTVAHGSPITGFTSATVPNGSTCISLQRFCNNGTLSNPSYNFNTCSVLPAPGPVGDSTQFLSASIVQDCQNRPIVGTIDGAVSYKRVMTGDYTYKGPGLDPNLNISGAVTTFSFKILINSSTTTQGMALGGFAYSDVGPNRAGRHITVSKTKCDFSNSAEWISPASFLGQPPLAANGNSSLFTINENPARADYSCSGPSGKCFNLTTGEWYVNVAIYCNPNDLLSRCDMVFQYAH